MLKEMGGIAKRESGAKTDSGDLMGVHELADGDETRWTECLAQLNIDHHAFSWRWRKVLQKTFGHIPRYFIYQGSSGCGVAPMFHFRSRLFGESLISVPYLNAGGIVGSNQAVVEELFSQVDRCARELKVSFIELRHAAQQPMPQAIDASRSHKVTMVLGLQPDPEELFSSFPPKLRSQIRRPTKSGLYAESIPGKEIRGSHLDDFYSVFSQHMRDLGTPVYPKSLFRYTVSAFADHCRLLIVRAENRAVAAGITIGAKSKTEILWASSLRSHNKLSPNMLLYWEAIKGAAIDGYSQFDFGRSSPDSGTFKFKKQWGAQPEVLQWHYRVYRGELPDVNPTNPKFQMMVSCWKKLPLPVANFVGPILTRGIP